LDKFDISLLSPGLKTYYYLPERIIKLFFKKMEAPEIKLLCPKPDSETIGLS
jgi:hypothetical protein